MCVFVPGAEWCSRNIDYINEQLDFKDLSCCLVRTELWNGSQGGWGEASYEAGGMGWLGPWLEAGA